MPQGLYTTKQTGFHLSTEDEDKNWDETMDATFNWSDVDNWSRTATENFATGGNIMGGSESWSKQKTFSFNVNNQFSIQKPFTLLSSISLYYTDGNRNTQSQDSTWQQMPINHTLNLGLNKYQNLGLHMQSMQGA